MGILSEAAQRQLIDNGSLRVKMQRADKPEPDFVPVARIYVQGGTASWLLTELDPDYPDIAFGLCDLGHGFPELGSVSITEIGQVKADHNLPIRQDEDFTASHTLSVYARAATKAAKITLDEAELAAAATTDDGGNGEQS